MTLSDATKQAILELQKSYPEKRSALIPALHLAQKKLGYLPQEIQKQVAELFDIDANEVHAVVTFYEMFFDKPVGKHIVHVCKNASCMLRGSDELGEALCKKLKTSPGNMTDDGEFTVILSECLAACDRAPMLLVDDEVIGPVKKEDLDAILEKAKKGKGRPCPMEAPNG
jgi:NADH-quinone oxidoreductase subunit E